MAIRYNFLDIKVKILERRKIETIIKLIATDGRKIPGDINIIITNNDNLLEINKKYLNHDFYTDVITFNYNEFNIISGDIYISFEMIQDNAQKYNTTWREELNRVIFHGVLHLIGIKDKTSAQKKEMTKFENYYLSEFSKL